MIAARQGSVNAAPAHQLGSPGYVGVLAIDEEIGIEELAVERNVLDHLTAIKGCRCRGSEDTLVLQVMPVVHFLATTVEVPEHRVEVDPGGIDQGLGRNVESRGHGQQLPADRADLRIDLPRIY